MCMSFNSLRLFTIKVKAMSTNSEESKIADLFKRIQVGPGFGLLLMGTLYLVFWLMPFALEEYAKDPRWAHDTRIDDAIDC
jgi:hypothetical protein